MCFSASASFIAGTALSAVGVATLRMTSQRAEIPFASFPLLFGIQQIVEGMIWLSFREGSQLPNQPFTLIYSFFSHVLWPILVPYAVGRLESVPWRKKALLACQLAGLAVGLYLLYFIVMFPVTSRVLGRHIVYESPHFYIAAVMTLYVAATCLSSLLSSERIIQVFGALSLATFVGAYLIHVATLVSVWCFFAAVLSFMVYLYFRRKRSAAGVPSSAAA
ncbi:MAG TPA: DUF6629 family protein [Steroidobacteraceae bacterium]|nr:DUF6629 family protein [Steroidobacteraceae bacterium]